jgi:hypothetical protein
MGIRARTETRSAGLDKAWRLLAAAVLLAFSFQCYLAQTHIHESAGQAATTHQAQHSKAPAGNSPMDCPFCQAVAHGGNFLTPDAALLPLAMQWVAAPVSYHLPAPARGSAKHHWQSRAPPSH